MKITFDFNTDDWMAFQKHYLENSKQFKRIKIVVLALMPLVFSIILVIDLINNNFEPVKMIIYSLVSVLWILFYSRRLTNNTLKKARKMIESGDNSGLLGQHEITFDDEGLVHITPGSETKIKWNGLKKMGESDDYYFLYNTAVSAIIIPKRKISDGLSELDILLRNHLNAADEIR